MSYLGHNTAARARAALAFLEAGGTVTLTEWTNLTPEDQDAMQAAGRALAVQQAVRIGRAAASDLGALSLLAETDEAAAAAHDSAVVAAAVRGASDGLRGRHGQ